MAYPIRGTSTVPQEYTKLYVTSESQRAIESFGPNAMLKMPLSQGSQCVFPLWPSHTVREGEIVTIRHLTNHLTLVAQVVRLFHEEQWNGILTAYGPCPARRKGFPTSAATHGCTLKVFGVMSPVPT
jgi:hypothetical protein